MSESIPEFVEIQRLQEDLAFCKTELAENQKYILELERELGERRKDRERIKSILQSFPEHTQPPHSGKSDLGWVYDEIWKVIFPAEDK